MSQASSPRQMLKAWCHSVTHIYEHYADYTIWRQRRMQSLVPFSVAATCGRDKRIWIWSVDDDDDYECASVLSSHTQDVKSVSWHPHKDTLVSTSYDDTIKLYEEQEDDWECINTLGKGIAYTSIWLCFYLFMWCGIRPEGHIQNANNRNATE